MKIGIDGRMYRSSVAGIGRYSQNLIKNLLDLPAGEAGIDQVDEFVLFMTKNDIEEFLGKGFMTDEDRKEFLANLSQKDVRFTGSASTPSCALATHFSLPSSPKITIVQTNIKHFSLEEQTKFGKIIDRENLDLMHFLNFNYPVNYHGKFIVTIHDLTLIFFPETAKQTNFIKRKAFHFVINKACRNSAKIIVDSDNTKKDVAQKFKIPEAKIKTIYLAADDKIFAEVSRKDIEELKKRYKLTKPIILYVGQFRPHKNLPSLIEAFDLVKKEIDCNLVICGKADPKHHRFYEALDSSPNKNDIIMPGFISDEELSAWYKIAAVFCFPSLYEGFGLPGLEAMSAGTAVVSSSSSSLPEIYQDAALYFDPFKIPEIAAKIKAVLSNQKLRTELIRKGKARVQNFNWRKTAEETLKVYKSI